MGKTSAIEWTDATWNPWMGCTKVSEGCRYCYMFRDAKRYGRNPKQISRSKTTFNDPLKWKEPKRIFVCSWSDFFHPEANEWRGDAYQIMRQTPHHTYLILTKRPEYLSAMLPLDWLSGDLSSFPNVWLGVSAENQRRFNERIFHLFRTPTVIRFVSAEPLLGPIDFTGTMPVKISHDPRIADDPIAGERIEYHPRIDWIITGGESGPNARLMDLDWARDIRDQCIAGEAKFFHKQHGGSKKINGAWGGRELDGRTWDELPDHD